MRHTAYVILVGVDNAQGPASGRRHAAADVRAVGQWATERLGVDEVVCHTLTAPADGGALLPTAAAVREAFAALARRPMRPDDVFVFYYAGRGVECGGEHFLLTSDSPADGGLATLRDHAVTVRQVGRWASLLGAGRQLLILDTGPGELPAFPRPRAVAVPPPEYAGLRFEAAAAGEVVAGHGGGRTWVGVRDDTADAPDAAGRGRFNRLLLNELADVTAPHVAVRLLVDRVAARTRNAAAPLVPRVMDEGPSVVLPVRRPAERPPVTTDPAWDGYLRDVARHATLEDESRQLADGTHAALSALASASKEATAAWKAACDEHRAIGAYLPAEARDAIDDHLIDEDGSKFGYIGRQYAESRDRKSALFDTAFNLDQDFKARRARALERNAAERSVVAARVDAFRRDDVWRVVRGLILSLPAGAALSDDAVSARLPALRERHPQVGDATLLALVREVTCVRTAPTPTAPTPPMTPMTPAVPAVPPAPPTPEPPRPVYTGVSAHAQRSIDGGVVAVAPGVDGFWAATGDGALLRLRGDPMRVDLGEPPDRLVAVGRDVVLRTRRGEWWTVSPGGSPDPTSVGRGLDPLAADAAGRLLAGRAKELVEFRPDAAPPDAWPGPAAVLTRHTATVTCATANAEVVVSGSHDGRLRGQTRGTPARAWPSPADLQRVAVTAVALSPDGRHVAAVGKNLVVRAFRADDGTPAWARTLDAAAAGPRASFLNGVCYFAGGAFVAVGGDNGQVVVLRAEDGAVVWHGPVGRSGDEAGVVGLVADADGCATVVGRAGDVLVLRPEVSP